MAESWVYLNGSFLPRSQATLDIEDRGAMFADGVYEVVRYYGGKGFCAAEHVERLRKSLAEIRIGEPPEAPRFAEISQELVTRNGLIDATAYWQVSRGVGPRKHLFPAGGPGGVKPTVLAIAYPADAFDLRQPPAAPPVRKAILLEDQRWARCNIKSLMLLPNLLAKQQAYEAGADEAILHRGNIVTEGSVTGVFIVRKGELWTHPANASILASITRAVVIELARALGIPVHEKTFTVDGLYTADELLICGTTSHVTAISHVGDRRIGEGDGPGPIARKLHEALMKRIQERCG